ncbi:hypothetical protein D2Q93_01555 [Alicyclobacillaceae bacterium I2511]|nr:hypothetical protein D2Q93_01555 [Alicyclobacillaceae bacterium I2511]
MFVKKSTVFPIVPLNFVPLKGVTKQYNRCQTCDVTVQFRELLPIVSSPPQPLPSERKQTSQAILPVSTGGVSSDVLEDFTLTAYALTKNSTGKSPGSPGFGITASGTKATLNRTVAVDPRIIPIGSHIYIDGIGWRIAEDTGLAIKGRHIDVLLPSDEVAWEFGVKRHIKVRVAHQPFRKLPGISP